MLKIIMEFRKGVLFVRLNGVITRDTIAKFERNVTKKIKKYKISSVVFNMNDVKKIDLKGINALFFIYELTNKEKGDTFLCNINNDVFDVLKKMKVFKYLRFIKDELEVFGLVKI